MEKRCRCHPRDTYGTCERCPACGHWSFDPIAQACERRRCAYEKEPEAVNTAKLAAALNTISVAFGELAEALTEQPEPERVERAATPAMTAPADAPAGAASPPAPPELSPFEDEAATWEPPDTLPAPAGSLVMCPKHHVLYKDGKYGKFCANVTDDEAWGKARDGKLWCRITPKNAAEWLRVTAAA